jgi:uncharacterized protein
MLIEFSVKNFRSIKEKQTLSMVASNRDNTLPSHLIDPQTPGFSKTKLLKSAAIYGANASGKSNIFKAAQFMRDYVVKSATEIKPGQDTGVVPFRLDSQTEKEPSEFEMIFIHEGIRYQYGFALDRKRIHEEWLIAYPAGLPQRWFSRIWNPEKNKYEWKFSSHLKGRKEIQKENTKENTLFLSMAVQLNNEQLSIIYSWFDSEIHFLDFSKSIFDPIDTVSMIYNNLISQKDVLDFLNYADLGISRIDIEDNGNYVKLFCQNNTNNNVREEEPEPSLYLFDFKLYHKNQERETMFTEEDESTGTLKLLSILGPFLFAIHWGKILFVDEIGANIHPLLIRKILDFLQNHYHPMHICQLIFTTHDTTQLNTDTLRRDQVWFTEKNSEGATSLYPLTDFKPRADESLQKGYLAGRYGAIPFLGEFTFK